MNTNQAANLIQVALTLAVETVAKANRITVAQVHAAIRAGNEKCLGQIAQVLTRLEGAL